MKHMQESQPGTVDFANIPHYLVEQISDLEQVIKRDTGKSVMLIAYETKHSSNTDLTGRS
jgi:hypothetical protein